MAVLQRLVGWLVFGLEWFPKKIWFFDFSEVRLPWLDSCSWLTPVSYVEFWIVRICGLRDRAEAHVAQIYRSPKILSSSRTNRLPEPRMSGCRFSMVWLVVLAGLLMPRRFLVITVIVWLGRVSSFVNCINFSCCCGVWCCASVRHRSDIEPHRAVDLYASAQSVTSFD